jgi:hypothetical protein
MRSREDADQFVGEGLAYLIHFREIEFDATKVLEARAQALGLRPRQQLFAAEAREPYRDYRAIEAQVVGRVV